MLVTAAGRFSRVQPRCQPTLVERSAERATERSIEHSIEHSIERSIAGIDPPFGQYGLYSFKLLDDGTKITDISQDWCGIVVVAY